MKDWSSLMVIGFITLVSIGIVLGDLIIYLSPKIYKEYQFSRKQRILGGVLNGVMVALLLMKYLPTANKGYLMVLLMLSTMLTAHFIIDCKYQDLPDLYNIIILILSVISVLTLYKGSIVPYIVTSITLFIGFLIIAVVTGSLGGGDIKLMGAVGMFFHYFKIPNLLMYPFFIGSIYAIALMLLKKKKRDDKFAFGPFLIIGIIITLLK